MEENEGLLDSMTRKVDEFFMPNEYQLETDTGYQRRIWDSRIEGYLNTHFDEYISTYEVVTTIDLERIEGKYDDIEICIKDLKDFALDTDAKVSNFEIRVETLKGKVK